MAYVLNRVGTAGGGGGYASIFVTGIPQTGNTVTAVSPTGQSLTSTWYSGGQVVNPEWRDLPTGYTQVEYIQPLNPTNVGVADTNNAANCYINTGYYPSNNTNVEVKFDISYSGRNTSGSQVLLGARRYYTNNMFTMFVPSSATTTVGMCISPYDSQIGTPSGYPTVVKNDGLSWYIDDVNTYTFSSYSTFTSIYEMQIFAFSDRGNMNNRQSDARIYYLKLWDSTTLTRDFVPCINSSNVVGLYDLVNSQFYSSGGSGTFSAGDEVPQYISASGYKFSDLDTYGTYVVTATDGSQTAVRNVLVDTATDFTVAMSYGAYLYNEGDECTSLTGGWSAHKGSSYITDTVTKNTDNMVYALSRSSSSYTTYGGVAVDVWNFQAGVITANKIDLTNYNTITIKGTISNWKSEGGSELRFTSSNSTDISLMDSSMVQYDGYAQSGNGAYEDEIDISSLSGSYYVMAASRVRYSGNTQTNTIESIKVK